MIQYSWLPPRGDLPLLPTSQTSSETSIVFEDFSDNTRHVSPECRAPGQRERASYSGERLLESVVVGIRFGRMSYPRVGSFAQRTGTQRLRNPSSLSFVSG